MACTEFSTGSVNRGTTGMNVSGGVSALQARITLLKLKMVPIAKITAADFNELVAIYDRWEDHTHSHNDLTGIDSFGDCATYGGSGTYIWRTTGVVSGAANSTASVIIGDDIAIGDVNSIIATINAIRTHTHSTTDSIS